MDETESLRAMTVLSLRATAKAKMPKAKVAGARALATLTLPSPNTPISLRAIASCQRTGLQQAQAAIKHVFVLMLENRSFDHVFGYSPITGLDPNTGTVREIENIRTKFFTNASLALPGFGQQTIAANDTAPYQLGSDADDPGHEFIDILRQVAGPSGPESLDAKGRLKQGVYPAATLDGFVQAFMGDEARTSLSPSVNFDTASIPMRCFAPARLPVLNTLAKAFAVCDAWHSSLPGPTLPNRLFVHAASSAGYDDSPANTHTGAAGVGIAAGVTMPNGTIFSRLKQAGRRWRLYSDDSAIMATTSFLDGVGPEDVRDFSDFADDINAPSFDADYVFIEPKYDALFSPKYAEGNSMHPVCDVRAGEDFLAKVYLQFRGSKIWGQSVLIVLFDEHGGFFDHMPPPVAIPPGDDTEDTAENNSHGFKFDRLGLRVPAIVISPFTPAGLVDGAVYDHASVPASIERLFGLAPMTARDAGAKDIWALLTLETPRTDGPQAFAPHPPPGAENVGQTSSALTKASTPATAAAGAPGAGMLSIFAGVHLKELKRRLGPEEYAAWAARLNQSLNADDLRDGLKLANAYLRRAAETNITEEMGKNS